MFCRIHSIEYKKGMHLQKSRDTVLKKWNEGALVSDVHQERILTHVFLQIGWHTWKAKDTSYQYAVLLADKSVTKL